MIINIIFSKFREAVNKDHVILWLSLSQTTENRPLRILKIKALGTQIEGHNYLDNEVTGRLEGNMKYVNINTCAGMRN